MALVLMKQIVIAAVRGIAAMVVGFLTAGITGDATHAGAFAIGAVMFMMGFFVQAIPSLITVLDL
jgi:hypothetical protein